jgi:hypothetical protein
MSKVQNPIRNSELARALAAGRTVTDWAKEKDVPERTAYRWAVCRAVRREVEMIRRAALDGAIAGLSQNATAAANQIIQLARRANSEPVRLQAARAVLAELIAVSNYAGLERRMTDIERQLAKRSRSPVPVPRPDPATPARPAGDRHNRHDRRDRIGPVAEIDGEAP